MSAPIPLRLIEATGRTRYTLRRYSEAKCKLRHGYHNAESGVIGETQDDPTKDYFGSNPPAMIPTTDDRWPRRCACGYAFEDADKSQVFAHPLFKFVDTGEVVTLEDAPAGAIWDASWWPDKGADGKAWSVRLPDGTDWMTENTATNCRCPKTPGHRCWSRSGTAPLLTVNPSIQTPRWHGWLRDGRLVEA